MPCQQHITHYYIDMIEILVIFYQFVFAVYWIM